MSQIPKVTPVTLTFIIDSFELFNELHHCSCTLIVVERAKRAKPLSTLDEKSGAVVKHELAHPQRSAPFSDFRVGRPCAYTWVQKVR